MYTKLYYYVYNIVTELNGTKRDVLELDYNQLSIGTVNTSITWRYSSLKCRPSVFFVEFFIERAAIGNQSSLPTLRLNSTTTSITIPTSDIQHHITSGALYLRLLAYDETGAACASDSAARFYKLNINGVCNIVRLQLFSYVVVVVVVVFFQLRALSQFSCLQ